MNAMLDVLLAPRHLVVTTIATLVAAGVFGGAIGFAAAEDDATVTVPTHLGLPAARLGDEAIYNVSHAGGSYTHIISREFIAPMIDRHGEEVLAEWSGGDAFELETGRYLAMGFEDFQSFSEVWQGNNPLITSQVIEGYDIRVDRIYPEADFSDCLRTNAFQGQRHDLAVGVDVFGACRIGPVDLSAGLLSFAAPVDGQVVLVADDGETRVTSTWGPASAYPLRVVVQQGEQRVEAVLEEASEGTVALPAAASVGRAAALELRPYKPWGLDETGFEHPFSPQTAYELAMESTTWTVLAEWAKRHADHWPVTLEYDEWQLNTGLERAWFFELTDGSSNLYMRVAMEERSAEQLSTGLIEDAPPVVTYRFEGESQPAREGRPTQMPARWPTAISLQARMQDFGHEALAHENLTSWRIDWYPAPEGMVPVLLAEMLRFDDSYDGFGLQAPSSDQLYGRAVFQWDGTAVAVFQDAQRHESGQRYIGQGSADPPRGGDAGQEPSLVTASTRIDGSAAWTVPTGAKAAGAGAAVVATGVLVWLWPLLKGLPVFGLFSRVRRPEMLGNPQRRRIVEAIEAEPGIHFGALLRRVGISNGSAVHHLRLLTQTGLVRERKEKGYTCYFVGRPTRHEAAAAPVLRAPAARRVLEVIQARPGCSAKDVAQQVGLSPGTVNHHLKRMRDAGLLDVRRDGRSLALHAA